MSLVLVQVPDDLPSRVLQNPGNDGRFIFLILDLLLDLGLSIQWKLSRFLKSVHNAQGL